MAQKKQFTKVASDRIEAALNDPDDKWLREHLDIDERTYRKALFSVPPVGIAKWRMQKLLKSFLTLNDSGVLKCKLELHRDHDIGKDSSTADDAFDASILCCPSANQNDLNHVNTPSQPPSAGDVKCYQASTGIKLGLVSFTLLAATGLLVQILWSPISRTDSGKGSAKRQTLVDPESQVVNASPPNEPPKQASYFVQLVRQADIFDFENHHLRFLPAKTLFTRALDPQLNHAKNSSIPSQHSSVLTAIRVSIDAGDSLSYYIDALPNGAPNQLPQYATATLNGNGKLYLAIIGSPPFYENSYPSYLLLTETGRSTRKFEIPEPLVGKTSTVSFALLLCQPSGPLNETIGLTLEYRDQMKP